MRSGSGSSQVSRDASPSSSGGRLAGHPSHPSHAGHPGHPGHRDAGHFHGYQHSASSPHPHGAHSSAHSGPFTHSTSTPVPGHSAAILDYNTGSSSPLLITAHHNNNM